MPGYQDRSGNVIGGNRCTPREAKPNTGVEDVNTVTGSVHYRTRGKWVMDVDVHTGVNTTVVVERT